MKKAATLTYRPSNSATKTSATTSRPLNILVLDDNLEWRQILKAVLECDLGVSPLVATSGEEALEILNSQPIDVVISDINMPVMNGVQFLKRAHKLFPMIEVVMLSVDTSMSQQLIDLGALAVISKIDIAPALVDLLRSLRK